MIEQQTGWRPSRARWGRGTAGYTSFSTGATATAPVAAPTAFPAFARGTVLGPALATFAARPGFAAFGFRAGRRASGIAPAGGIAPAIAATFGAAFTTTFRGRGGPIARGIAAAAAAPAVQGAGGGPAAAPLLGGISCARSSNRPAAIGRGRGFGGMGAAGGRYRAAPAFAGRPCFAALPGSPPFAGLGPGFAWGAGLAALAR